jgi:glycerol-3-phosphate dehydrogenase
MYYIESPSDQRAIFIMPWQGNVMVGTTETPFDGSPDNVKPPEQDIQYLLNIYNDYFSTAHSTDDVINAFAGLRVLPKSSGKAFNRSRDTLIHYDPNQPLIFTLYGGKLTAHRATARKLINIISKHRS